MGRGSGGGGGFARGTGTAFASTYGTSGTFFAAHGETGKAKYVGSTDRYYQVGVYGNGPKKMGFPTFNTAKEANDFMAKLAKNGFKPQGGKQKPFKQVYGYLDSHYHVQWTTDKSKKNNGF